SVWDSVGDSVGASVGDSVWDSVGDSVGASVGDSVKDSGYGQHDANWLAFYEFFKDVCGLEQETKNLSGLWKVSKNAGWYLPHENICWISEKHNKLSRNTRGLLHSDTGIALQYPDGWGIYALNGVKFPKDLWEKVVSKKMSFKEVMAIQDIDQRTQAMNYCPPREFLNNKGKLLNKSEKGNELWLIPQSEGLFRVDAYFLMYKCPSTGKEYLSGIDPEIGKQGKADNCMLWKFNIQSLEDYYSMIES
nr:hypothetical protein [Candidatus Nanoarchaeia archaeon]